MLKQRFNPADIKEDIKIAQKVPMMGIINAAITMAICVFFVLILMLPLGIKLNIFVSLLIVFGPGACVLLVSTFDLINRVITMIDFSVMASKVKNLNTLLKKPSAETVYYNCTAFPFEVATDGERDKRADDFAQDALAEIREGKSLHIYGICKAEDISVLEYRLNRLDSLPEKLRRIEKARIEHHFKLSKTANQTQYIVALSDIKEDDQVDPNMFNGHIIGDDMLNEIINSHLTPGAIAKRGKKKVV